MRAWDLQRPSTTTFTPQTQEDVPFVDTFPELASAYTSTNVSVDALRNMSSHRPSRHVRSVSRSAPDGKNAVLLPLDGNANVHMNGASHSIHVAWSSEPMGAPTQCRDPSMDYKDRLGRTVHVYPSCPPPAQKDFGVRKGDADVRRRQGVTSTQTTVRRREVAEAPLSLTTRNAPGDDAILRTARTNRTSHVQSSLVTNKAHAIPTERDDARDQRLYDGHNLRRGNESRAGWLKPTERSYREHAKDSGRAARSQRAFPTRPIPDHRTDPHPHAPLGAPQTALLSALAHASKPTTRDAEIVLSSSATVPLTDVRRLALVVASGGAAPGGRPDVHGRDATTPRRARNGRATRGGDGGVHTAAPSPPHTRRATCRRPVP